MADPLKTIDRLAEHLKQISELAASDVLIGIPAAKTGRKDGQMTNASLAYIHEYGSPAHNIPARPFLFPGVKAIRAQAIQLLRDGARDVLLGKVKASVVLNKVGILARNSVVKAITDPAPPFVPLKPATIRARLRRTAAGRRKLRGLRQIKQVAGWTGAQSNQALTEWGEAGNIKPLIDTGQLRAAITYVVRKT
jgi:hypothetical protein